MGLHETFDLPLVTENSENWVLAKKLGWVISRVLGELRFCNKNIGDAFWLGE